MAAYGTDIGLVMGVIAFDDADHKTRNLDFIFRIKFLHERSAAFRRYFLESIAKNSFSFLAEGFPRNTFRHFMPPSLSLVLPYPAYDP